jgi:hypothetical protein
MDANVNAISFLSTVLASIGVVAVSIYGAAQFIRFGRILAGFGILAIIPIWFGVQLLFLITFDVLVYLGVATRENHLEYVMTPVLNLACAGLVGYTVIYLVGRLTSLSSQDQERILQAGANGGVWSSFSEPRKVAGVIFIAIGAATMPFFVISGVLFVVVGVSLIMNVRLWRK